MTPHAVLVARTCNTSDRRTIRWWECELVDTEGSRRIRDQAFFSIGGFIQLVALKRKNLRERLADCFFIVYHLEPADRQRAVAVLTAWLERGALAHRIAERLPLADIAAAHEAVEQGRAVGNVVLAIP